MAVRNKFKLVKYEHIIYSLKHVTWRFRICNYEHFKKFAKSVFARISAKFKYLAKQFILTESPDHVL